MYTNKCIKCGVEFETKNPKRVICPSCLYPDKKPILSDNPEPSTETYSKAPSEGENQGAPQQNYYSQGEGRPQYPRQNNFNGGGHQGGYRRDNGGYQGQGGGYQRQGGYQGGGHQGGGYQQQGGGFQRQGGYQGHGGGYQQQGGGFRRPPQQGGFQGQGGGYQQQGSGFRRPPQQGGFQGQGGGFRRPPQQGGFQGGGFRRPPQQGGFQGGGFRRGPVQKRQLLISREQVAQIEVLYKRLLPLPNPDAHELIGAEIGLEPHKVFFGINLVRQKLFLPKLPYPKRKLAVSPEQLMAIKSLYEPLLPLPPIGCHKIIAAQLRMDEWRVHVGIGIIRKQMNMPRWNAEREDAPEEFKNQVKEAAATEVKEEEAKPKAKAKAKTKAETETELEVKE